MAQIMLLEGAMFLSPHKTLIVRAGDWERE